MSVFNEILFKINDISKNYVKSLNDELEEALKCIDKFEEDYFKERNRGREKAQKDKNALTTLQSINEDEDFVQASSELKTQNDKATIEPLENGTSERSSNESDGSQNGSKKRNKNEVDGMDSPKQGKRQKRNASAKALANISKQINLNLNQKLRREDETTSQKQTENDKENIVPIIPPVQIKQEKISVPPEPEPESLPIDVVVKKEVLEDAVAMPPPVLPVPKPRKMVTKEKSQDDTTEDEESSLRRSTRPRKQTDKAASAVEQRTVRASSRSARNTQAREHEEQSEDKDGRPKRTRGRKKLSKSGDETQCSQESAPSSPADKPRPKRTRRALKAAAKEDGLPGSVEISQEILSPKEEIVSRADVASPILQKEANPQDKPKKNNKRIDRQHAVDSLTSEKEEAPPNMELEVTRVLPAQMNETVTIANNEMDKTVVLTNGVYNHAPVTPIDKNKVVGNVNETVIIEKNSKDSVDSKQQNQIMDATVVIEKAPDANAPKISEDISLLTNDSDPEFLPHTPPKKNGLLPTQQTSAVKEKVQQFEELATRVTRTKTRALAKKEQESCDNQTPPDKVFKPALSAETLDKMNAMIFNGKPPQTSRSVTKPWAAAPHAKAVSSASKVSAIRAREAEEAKREVEDARKKKEAMLEAKREMHRKKREDKMAAAAATRIAAERERRLAVEAMERERREKQAQVDQGRVDRLKEAEKKRLELARKVAETEERRRAEEKARQARLAEEQRKGEALRRKQLEEAEATKREAAIMAREIEKRKREYNEKQKLKNNRHDDKFHTPLKGLGCMPPPAMEPVYMEDGFQYLNSDEDAEVVSRPTPKWCLSSARHLRLAIQTQVAPILVDRLFSVQVHSPDLREIFPSIERSRLKRTSSAVWRTPPSRMHTLPE